MKYRALLNTVFTLLCLLAVFSVWAVAPEGTTILSQTRASFYDGQTGALVNIISNQSKIDVGSLVKFELGPNQSQKATPGQQVYFIHRLTNRGNMTDRYQLNARIEGAENATAPQIYAYHGILPDTGSKPLQQTRPLNVGETMQLIVLARIPTDVSAQGLSIVLSATSVADKAVQQISKDQVVTSNGAVVQLIKTVNQTEVKPGEALRYRVGFRNVGNQPVPLSESVMVEGKPFKGVVLESKIPANTSLNTALAPDFAPFQARLVLRSENGSWTTFDNWSQKKNTPTRIGLLLPELPAGHSGFLSFSTKVDDETTGNTLITNQARLHNRLTDAKNFEAFEAFSNPVSSTVQGKKATVRFVAPVKAPDFFAPDGFEPTGQYYLYEEKSETSSDVYLEVHDSSLNQSKENIDSISSVTIRSNTGDSVQVKLVETAANSGIFRSHSPLRLQSKRIAKQGVCRSEGEQPDYTQPGTYCYLQAKENDTLTASIADLDTTASVNPQGMVFRTDSLAGLSGAEVTFTNVASNETVKVPASGDSGEFYYPRLKPGRYVVAVNPPKNFNFPSKMPPDNLPGRKVTEASYGPDGFPKVLGLSGSFEVNEQHQIDQFDIPVDPMDDIIGTLSLTKAANRSEISPGDRVDYKLTLINHTEQALTAVQVQDYLPRGFKYLPGSTFIDDRPAQDPEGGRTAKLTFGLTLPENNTAVTVRYTLQARAGAIDSDGINRAQAFAKRANTGMAVKSNEARAQVTVRMDGVLSNKAIVFGRVAVEACEQAAAPIGIAGVRLYMEDGTWVITDENGQYSLMGLNHGNHVLKVDPVTLPEGVTLKANDNRHALDANSRFIDLVPGEMHRANFVAQCPADERILKRIKDRNKNQNSDWLLDDAVKHNRTKPTEKSDNNGDLSNGLIGANSKSQPSGVAQKNDDKAVEPETETAGAKMPQPQEAIKTVTREQARAGTFLWPAKNSAGELADGRFMVVVRSGIKPVLYINGEAVAKDRLGEQLLNQREQAQLLVWYGIALQEGENRIEVKATDMFGNERILADKTFNYAGAATTIELTPEANMLAADDGRSLLPVTIKLLDNHGLPARGLYFVTLEASAGRWQGVDIQDREPGHQIRITNGIATVNLRSGKQTGPLTLKATSGGLSAKAQVTQVAPSRPLMAVGLIDINSGSDTLASKSRAAMFVKGGIGEDTHLTLSYDNKKNDNTELFRDVDPNDYYPITGDGSEKGYEAQSRSKLYAKVERELSSIMWGDYKTDNQSSPNDLARVQRNLTGVNAIYDNGSTRVQAFAARPENSLRSETLTPNGTAMNYRLQGTPIIRHSETVSLEVWSKENPGLMLNTKTLSRGRDYTLDEFSGYLKFANPIASRDSDGNPQKIRVSYEVKGDGEAYTVAGARVQQQLSEQVSAGASYTLDQHTSKGSEVGGIWVEYKPTDKTTIAVSGARMSGKTADDGGQIKEHSGNAARVKIKHQWKSNGADSGTTELTWAKADEHFTNSSGGISAGREELSLKHRQKVTSDINLRAEVEVSRAKNDSGDNKAGVFLDKTFDNGLQVTAGSRYISQKRAKSDEQSNFATAKVGVKKRFSLLEKDASLSASYEQALTNSRWQAELEGNWQLHEKVALYGRFERDNNLKSSVRNEFSLGVKSNWLTGTKVYSEYRLRGVGNTLEWVNGADARIEVTKGLSLSPSVEWINTVSGDNRNDGVALSLGIDDKRYKYQRATARAEYRYSEQQDYYGFEAAIARRLNRDWSGLVREQLRLEDPKNDSKEQRLEHTLTLGFAHRPKLNDVQHGLYLYQWKEEREEDRSVHLISTHQNRKICPDLTLSGRLGTKWVAEEFNGNSHLTQTTLLDTRLTWDINSHWDVDLRFGALSVDGDDSVRWSAGAGVSYLAARNLRIGVHYNLLGFRDKDLDDEKHNAEGIHFSLQFKFDESLFDWFKS